MKKLKKKFYANDNPKKAEVTIFILDKIDFKSLCLKNEGYYIMIKESIQPEDKTIINIYAPNIRAPKYIKQILTILKRDINSNTIMKEDFITILSIMG